MSAKFHNHSLKTVLGVKYTNSIPNNAKKLPKMTSNIKCSNSLKINSRAIKNHAHTHCMHYIHNQYAGLQKEPLKTVEGVDYTNSIPSYAKMCLK